ncbi:50S ribosomal protein L21 [Prosthecochloris sp. HL-130-GSB]|jgi:large subunit ribosomal protein L21|uniref:Large ribosomal subunit protein bL21 n=1 Tax=Prosthecochloris aestuarii TaxID=1102 RepID=A0A831SNC5_PROAE|nr:50S ribosomal protein L21 [Prosthecochloris sp. HL-130-GSB]ARM30599.1 50S ribosomal protein L21 [Prosthecochloris sp. HL-130-GSB]MBO8093249.1 50S ribosomal protein L21 [Prosthecochloris sp.]HED31752.1 50S ribosomal protein L21 [Prosthecochloris aestuarii]
MQALIEISDKQYLVRPGDTLMIPRQDAEIGSVLDIKPMVTIDRENTSLQPSGNVQVKVLEHLKGDKVIVFKKKRRKRYQCRNGHRQQLTRIEVLST